MLKMNCYSNCVSAFFIVLTLLPSPVHGAPFCVEVPASPGQCIYFDTRQCWQDAGKQKGICAANLSELAVAEADKSVCMIDSARIPVCGYQSLQSCQNEARSRNAVCFQNPKTFGSDKLNKNKLSLYR